ncbi:hypothetical protein L3Q82_003785 [Scortum barcoo]|uniref:Uncharacterized protein n=1 Tax=Scortum barcoo TaxID=214431 RepID=A0ACB8X5S2_9TELE|nr:hypothetical protein L3Q82_003785 [Scortum barcoo]
MEVTALRTRLLMDVLVLLAAQAHHSYFVQQADAAFPRISPDRLQFFEYETVTINCEDLKGSTEWRVMWTLNKTISTNSSNWKSSAPSYTINPAFKRHSGHYWCEDAERNISDTLNIAVTDGLVILEVPVHPVLEGQDVVLYCRRKDTQKEHIADFYKDGVQLGTEYKSSLTIRNISKSHEGLYKCRISEAGESPESLLSVLNHSNASYEEILPSHYHSPDFLPLMWIVISVFLAVLLLLLLLLLLGLLCRNRKVLACFSSRKPTPAPQSQNPPGEDRDADPRHATYAVVVKNQRKKKEPEVSREHLKPRLPEESTVYSSVNYKPLTPD